MTDEGHRNFNFECHEAAHRSQADHRLRGKKTRVDSNQSTRLFKMFALIQLN